jgi:SAM-dependent MidA family methyltransferase
MSETIILQKNTAFAKSDLWKLQRRFFEEQGIMAWNNKVPYHITSNPGIANAYANIIIRFIQDCINQEKYNPLEFFYIIELGAGSGKFSFYTIQCLFDLFKQFEMQDVKLKYVMTDFTLSNIDFWKNHPALAPYIETGFLDFAKFDIETDQEINLINSGVRLNKKKNLNPYRNPMIVIANYVFDTVAHDVFYLNEGQLQNGLVTISVPKEQLIDGHVKELESITTNYCYRNCDINYYSDKTLQAILAFYKNHYKNIKFLFPIGSLKGIKHLQDISGNQLLLLTTDKGYSNCLEDFEVSDPHIAFHSSFSLMVNFHAIGLYFKYSGGDCYYQNYQNDILTCAYLLGNKFKQLPETRTALIQNIDHFSPANLFKIYQHIYATLPVSDLNTLLSYLAITHWYPALFDDYIELIIDRIDKTNPIMIKDWLAILPKLAAHYYYLPAASNTLFNIGKFLQAINECKMALKYYEESLNYQYQHEETYYNMGICHYNLGNFLQATELFKQILVTNKQHILTYGWLAKAQAAAENCEEVISIE